MNHETNDGRVRRTDKYCDAAVMCTGITNKNWAKKPMSFTMVNKDKDVIISAEKISSSWIQSYDGILFTSRCCFNSIYLKWFLM